MAGSRFECKKNITARPTTDFARENLFNVLENLGDFEGKTALDLLQEPPLARSSRREAAARSRQWSRPSAGSVYQERERETGRHRAQGDQRRRV